MKRIRWIPCDGMLKPFGKRRCCDAFLAMESATQLESFEQLQDKRATMLRRLDNWSDC